MLGIKVCTTTAQISTLFLKQGFSPDLKLTNSAQVAGWKAFGSPGTWESLLLPCWDYWHALPNLDFYVGAGAPNLGPLAVFQSFMFYFCMGTTWFVEGHQSLLHSVKKTVLKIVFMMSF